MHELYCFEYKGLPEVGVIAGVVVDCAVMTGFVVATAVVCVCVVGLCVLVVCCWVTGSGADVVGDVGAVVDGDVGAVVDGDVGAVVDVSGGGVVWKELVLLSKRLRSKAKSVTNKIVLC